jgi:hypothetical protein
MAGRVPDLFISYAREDQASAQAIAGPIRAAGWDVWWDQRLRGGDDFSSLIEEHVRTARCVLVLWSRHSRTSLWVKAEASVALERGVLLQVLLDDATPPLPFTSLHCRRLNEEGGWQFLIDEVKARLGTSTRATDASIQGRPAPENTAPPRNIPSPAHPKRKLGRPGTRWALGILGGAAALGLVVALTRSPSPRSRDDATGRPSHGPSPSEAEPPSPPAGKPGSGAMHDINNAVDVEKAAKVADAQRSGRYRMDNGIIQISASSTQPPRAEQTGDSESAPQHTNSGHTENGPSGLRAVGPVTYSARLDARDHCHPRGKRLCNAAEVFQQDRYYSHSGGGTSEDEAETYFSSRSDRESLKKALYTYVRERGFAERDWWRQITDFTPMVKVTLILSDGAIVVREVKIVDRGTPLPPCRESVALIDDSLVCPRR